MNYFSGFKEEHHGYRQETDDSHGQDFQSE